MRLLLACLLFATPAAWAAHGYALWGDLKYPPGFKHFDYVNPAAPRGGEIRMVSGLRNSGMVAPMVLDGPINGIAFQAYIDQVLVPELRPGDIVIMDNLGSHKSPAVRQMVSGAGARLWYLPPYSPDLAVTPSISSK